MFTRENVIEKVKSFIDELLAQGIPLQKAILFGSYAKNNQRENSDIDVALISDIFTGFGFEDRKYFSRINNKEAYIDIDTRTYSTDYYLLGDPFIAEINNTGIEMYNAMKEEIIL